MAVAVVLGLVVPSLPRLSGRAASLNRAVPVTSRVLNDPLDAMAGLRDDNPGAPARTVLRVRTGPASNGYLASAVLDDYDGGTWSFDSHLQADGRAGAGPQRRGHRGSSPGRLAVRQQVSLVQPLPLPFLPALDRPVAVRGLEVAADPATGMLLPEHAEGGLVAYEVVSSARSPRWARCPARRHRGVGGGGAARRRRRPIGREWAGREAGVASDLALPPDSAPAMGVVMRFLATHHRAAVRLPRWRSCRQP